MIDIKDKWALITGASRGVGKEVAKALAQKGCNLVLHSRKTAGTEKLAKELSATGVKVHQTEAEMADIGKVKELAQKAEELSGGIDILFNNAAVMTAYKVEYFTTPQEDYITSFKINTIAPITMCNHFLPRMKERGFGRIVNVTSGIKEQPELLPYATSKAALDKYVYDMAPHLKGTGVMMNLLDPGWLRTDLGGPKAPNPVESVIPGALVPILLDEDISGKFYCAQDYRED
ncbi:MAG: SDR family NAD(P)-dependent oxidoreductase [Chitinispirillaceae bacterium]